MSRGLLFKTGKAEGMGFSLQINGFLSTSKRLRHLDMFTFQRRLSDRLFVVKQRDLLGVFRAITLKRCGLTRDLSGEEIEFQSIVHCQCSRKIQMYVYIKTWARCRGVMSPWPL